MGLKLRQQKTDTNNNGNNVDVTGASLTFAQGDSNLIYLLTNMSGSNVNITGSTGILGNLTVNGSFILKGLSLSSGPNVIMYDTTSGQFFYQSTGSINVGSASYVSSSKVDGPYGLDSIRSASYASGSTSASYALSASQATTASYITGSTFGSTNPVTSASYALTASYTPGAGAVGSSLTQGTGITSFTYNGSSAQTVAVSGAASLTTNAITKWNGSAFVSASLTDNGTTITGTTSIQLTGASSNLTGSFTGSFSGSFNGNGAGLTGVTATPSFPTSIITGLSTADKFFVNDDPSGNSTSNNKQITYGNLLVDLAGTNLVTESNDSLALATTITGITSITSTSFTGSLSGSATTASYVNGNIFTSTNLATSASYAVTASYVPTIKAGNIAASSFTSTGGDPYIGVINLSPAFASNNYAITVTGEDARSWTIQSKSATSFTINTNSTVALTGGSVVWWIAIPYNS
jgi:hypothetical protein